MSEWKPITADAPKKGKWVLIQYTISGQRVLCGPGLGCPVQSFTEEQVRIGRRLTNGKTFRLAGRDNDGKFIEVTPSLWQELPLPQPPEGTK